MKFFETPPGGSSLRKIDWEGAKVELVANEGEWGLIAERVAGSHPQQLHAGKNVNFRGDTLKHYEFVTRRPVDAAAKGYSKRQTDLYGRYSSKPLR